ncbi:AMP-dependent synthetase/ligase [Williamsia maris]|uniref:Acyl-CoA synthetase n=1 Tax=Williamsia maris TaxID=72806 RepID=A0ABT1HFI3_9NOCA|nr:long-chain fatty acid--CoA ligase [Williamsia maris]MCP2176993.1 long-chain acyl-CoA synthetase [Williamsia maris]
MREHSVPATFEISPDDHCGNIIVDIAGRDPDQVVFRIADGSEWKPLTAKDLTAQIDAVAKGLVAQGVAAGDRVALLSSTRPEWSIIDFAIWSAGAVTVPIYDSSSGGQIDWILQDSEATALIIENDAHRSIVEDLEHGLSSVRRIYQIDGPAGSDGAIAELTEQGADVDPGEITGRRSGVTSSDPATLIYTSGTTGRPKGCMLTHSNLLSETAAVLQSDLRELLQPGSRTLMFLPMAHVLARAITIVAIQSGTEVGFTSDIPKLVAHFGEFRPDFILSVPRVFEKVYNTARQNAGGGPREKLFDAAADTAVEYSRALDTGGPGLLLRARHSAFDRLVYSKLRDALGGRCRLAISGGAPLGERLGHFYRGMGVPICEGYGLTETTAAFSVNTPDAQRIGTVGKPLGGNTVRIADDGEVMLFGGVVFDGYWRNSEATDEALTDGWFHTGDLGSVDDDGYITITGRKKELIVTAGGKNVSPSGIEDAMRSEPLISQAMLVGDGRPFIGALVTIDPDEFTKWKSGAGKSDSAQVADLVDDEDLREVISNAVEVANRTVSHAEGVKKFRILPEDFSESSGEMTPTMKMKRSVISDKFSDEIEALYGR